jgi:hypothetical protein
MRRFALLGLTLLLPACSGFDTFFNDTHWFGRPNQPLGDSENMRRARGQSVIVPQLLPEPGNVWPGPIPPQPTLEQLMREENKQTQPAPAPGQPQAPLLPAPPGHRQPRGSSTPPGSVQPSLPPPLTNVPPAPAPNLPSSAAPRGHTYQTPSGPVTGAPGPGGYETLTTPKGEPGGIAVPNGNGTTTLIMPDGRVLTVPSPK